MHRIRCPTTCWVWRRTIITPQGRTSVGFDDPIAVSADARALDRLLAYTGRTPS